MVSHTKNKADHPAGNYTEGSGLLIMAIAGGALSALQGVIADRIGLQLSYLLPAACYVHILFYALWGAKATAVLQDERFA